MRDYTIIPGYEDYTPLDAQFHYAMDLLDEYRGITPEAVREHGWGYCKHTDKLGFCHNCELRRRLEDAGIHWQKICAWTVMGDDVDKAIGELEELTGRGGDG